MRIVEINAVNNGSTGNIMLQIADEARENGMEVLICVPKSRSNMQKKCEGQFQFGDRMTRNLHILLARFTGFQDCFSVIATSQLLKRITAFEPDVIHLHNLHGNYINLPMLFHYIMKKNIPVVWTLHDCWSFTGQCPYFTMIKCEKWKTGCQRCPQINKYPSSRVDRTRTMWKLKRKWFNSIKNMTIVTPSKWLADLVKESYLKEYPVKVINNGINLDIFKPTVSDVRERYGIKNKFIILGVAFSWGVRKGLDVFIKLAKRLDSRYQIVLIGTTDEIDKQLPSNIISIHRTTDQKELAEIYTVADVFVNPTREENYPTVNMESIACGTPVITFNTGGSPEILNENTGYVIDVDNIDEMERKIISVCKDGVLHIGEYLNTALEFDQRKKYKEYLKLYKSILGDC